jgi:hypothetical protein
VTALELGRQKFATEPFILKVIPLFLSLVLTPFQLPVIVGWFSHSENDSAFVVGRGVLLDLCRHRQQTPLPAGTVLIPKELESCAIARGVELREEDIVLLRTGWLATFDERQPSAFFRVNQG